MFPIFISNSDPQFYVRMMDVSQETPKRSFRFFDKSESLVTF